jgi:hypothetical protein
MGAVVPFIPAIAGAIGGIFGGKRATAAAQQRSPEEAQALAGGQQAGGNLLTQGAGLFGTGTGMVGQGAQTLAQPTSYYQKLLGGNRALASQAVSAPRGAISDIYRGAERGLERSGVRGAARDVASAELGRQRAGQMSSLITGVQPGAAEALTGIGQTQIEQGAGIAGQGVRATAASGNIFASLLGQGAANRQYARGEGERFGGGFGSLIFDLLSGIRGSRGGGGGGQARPAPSWGGPA